MVRVSKLELDRTISDIMRKGDLDQLTTKKIRMICEKKYKIDLTSRKDEIDKIVMAFVTEQSEATEKESGAQKANESGAQKANESVAQKANESGAQKAKKSGAESSDSSSYESGEEVSTCSSKSGSQSCSDSECSYSESSDEESVPKNKAAKPVNNSVKPVPKKAPVKRTMSQVSQGSTVSKQSTKPPAKVAKKANPSKQIELDDAALARQLQAEEWNFRQRTVKKLFRDIPQKKTDKKDQPKKKKASPFLKKCQLSPALAEVIGTNEMSRPDVVQKMWSVVRERNLFDESNKQYALCDEQLTKIFGKKRVRLIGMMKYLKHHIKDIN